MGVHVPNCPAVTSAPWYLSDGPTPLLLSRKKCVPTCSSVVTPLASITVPLGADGIPMTPSPLRSWWKLVSADSHARLVPDTEPLSESLLPLLSVSQIELASVPGIF